MVFSSTVFLFLFLPAVLILYYNPLLKSRTFRNVLLLLASLVFYAWGEPVFVFLMLLSISVTWAAGKRLAETHSKTVLTAGVVWHVLILFIFKYLSFAVNEIGLFFHSEEPLLSIPLPIGISFFTFQMLSYLFDVWNGKAKAQSAILCVGLYTALFPQLIAGPIVRYGDIAQEITERQESFSEVILGMKQFVYGLGKKVLIANYVAQVADNAFDYLTDKSVAMAWLGAVCYTLQIYFDFSGYSDMAIGLGQMFGFHFRENFNYPYISASVTDFWRRWHISLSTWFKDYVYIPLGGNRVSTRRWVWNFFVVWLLTGLWHGANWTFLAWGMLYFLILVVEKLSGLFQWLSVAKGRTRFVGWIYTMFVVNLAWVVFRSESLSAAAAYIGTMFGVGTDRFADASVAAYLSGTKSVLIVALFAATPVYRICIAKLRQRGFGWMESLWLLAVFLCSVLAVISSTYNPFIYFNF